MKRSLFTLLVLLCVFCSYGQDAGKILSNFLTVTGLDKYSNETLRLELTMQSQGTVVPIVVSFSSDRKKIRMEMTIQESVATMVITENDGWIESGGQIQPLPAEFISQTKYLTFFASVSEILKNSEYSYLGDDEYYHKIEIKPNDQKESYHVFVNKSSGYIDKVLTAGHSQNTIYFIGYNKISDTNALVFPSKIAVEAGPQSSTDFIISKVQLSLIFPDNFFQK